ncbi:hypothetical protein [Streptomyces sp. TRM68367]|uniref:hypothetical protein n=1 Tax=Streptomyces sp. TRM68367 TaxID=2758415 RepID=UPI00165C0045|nr:hypothetical protein [Streptomyces sp. TRM68367]MBC9725708.1 hypothetical protein [Streptomyces sp. TRM68367]
MPATERDESPPRVASGVSMRELLAACDAAALISTPPRAPEPETSEPPVEEHPKAA